METFIRVYDDVISEHECTLFLKEFKQSNASLKKDEINFDGHQLEYMNLDGIPLLASFDFKVQDVAQKQVDKYLAEFSWIHNKFYLENSMLLHIAPNQGLPLHSDNEFSEGGLRRNFIVLMYLQDMDVGGELLFPRQSLVVRPKAGRMIIAPTFYTHPHTVLPTLEDRYTYRINFFIKSGNNDIRRY